MSNAAKPARLWLNKQRGLWYILDVAADGKRRQSPTGCAAAHRQAAEGKLAEYIGARAKPSLEGGRDPSSIVIAELLNIYLTECCAKPYGKRTGPVVRLDEVARRCGTLADFFGDRPVTALSKPLCGHYATQRGDNQTAARRELEDLSSALGYAFDQEILEKDFRNRIVLPPKPEARERWLTHDEAARLLRSCWRFRQRDRSGELGRLTRQHVARFILAGLYTGTRSAAICGAALGPAVGRGYVDLDHGLFYRREPGTAQTMKKQPPVRLPDRLLAHMRRWKRRGISLSSVVEYEGQAVQSVKKAFREAVIAAGLEIQGPRKVTPHTLRHTAITWALQAGQSTWDVSDFFGVSEQIIRKVYGHHCPDRHRGVGDALTRRRKA